MGKVKLLGPEPPKWFTSDGCTHAPDKWFGHDFHEACRWHDWAYSKHTKIRRITADCYLFVNMIQLGAPWRLAITYFIFVRRFGKSHFEQFEPGTTLFDRKGS